MSKGRWKVGIVGCGKIAGGWDGPQSEGPVVTHAQAYHRHPSFQLVAAAEPDPESLGRFQRTWGISSGYQSVKEMQDAEGLDVVSICSPDELHFAQAEEGLTSEVRPRVLLVEKPVCLEAGKLDSLAEMAQRAGAEIVVNHTRRFDETHRRVARLVREGRLGGFLGGRCTYYGGWMHNGTHAVDTLRMLFDDEPRVVTAAVSNSGSPGDENLDVRLLLGRSAVVVEGFDESYYQLFESELRFESGRVRLLDFGSTITIEKMEVNELGERVLRLAEGSPLQGLVSTMYAAVEAIDSYLQGRGRLHELGVDLSAAALTMEVMWQAREMAASSSAGSVLA